MANEITFLTDDMMEMAIGKEVKLVEDLYNNAGTRCMKKESAVGILVFALPHIQEATVQFGNRKHKVSFSQLIFNNIEDEMFIKNEDAAKKQRIAIAKELISKRNELANEYHTLLEEKYGKESSEFVDGIIGTYPLEWAEESNSENDIQDYKEEIENVKGKLAELKSNSSVNVTEDTPVQSLSNSNVVDFKNEKMNRGMNKIWSDFESKSDEDIMKETYIENLYLYTCGQSGNEHLGWLKGVEYMMSYIGIDYIPLRNKVLTRIKNEGRTIINKHFFEDGE